MGVDTAGSTKHGGFRFYAQRLQLCSVCARQPQHCHLAEIRRQYVNAAQEQRQIHIAVSAGVALIHQPRFRRQAHLLLQRFCRKGRKKPGGEVRQYFIGAGGDGLQTVGAAAGAGRYRCAADKAGTLLRTG